MDARIKLKPELKVIRKEEIPHLLVPGEMGAILELTVRDKRGKVTEHRIMRSKSFVKQFLQLLWIKFNDLPNTVPLSVRDTSNALQDLANEPKIFECDGAAGDDTLGIIVGKGTDGAATTPTIDDYKIEAIIPDGHAGNDLDYSETIIAAAAHDATTSQVTITRDFANNSGGAVTVYEIALYVLGVTGKYFMTIRDAIAGGIAVPDGQTLTVNYREQAVA